MLAQPRSGAVLRAAPHVQRRCLSSSYLPPAHFANSALTRFLSPLSLPTSLPPSLLSLFPVEMLSVPHSASSSRSSTCIGIAHADLCAGSVGPVQVHTLPFLPLHRGFSPGGRNCGEQRRKLIRAEMLPGDTWPESLLLLLMNP